MFFGINKIVHHEEVKNSKCIENNLNLKQYILHFTIFQRNPKPLLLSFVNGTL